MHSLSASIPIGGFLYSCASSAINLHKAGIYIEAEAEVKFMLLLQNLFTLKQKYGGRIVTAVNQLQYIHLAIGLHSINERPH